MRSHFHDRMLIFRWVRSTRIARSDLCSIHSVYCLPSGFWAVLLQIDFLRFALISVLLDCSGAPASRHQSDQRRSRPLIPQTLLQTRPTTATNPSVLSFPLEVPSPLPKLTSNTLLPPFFHQLLSLNRFRSHLLLQRELGSSFTRVYLKILLCAGSQTMTWITIPSAFIPRSSWLNRSGSQRAYICSSRTILLHDSTRRLV